jgi:UDP-2-acetamido-2-deoxy-ribo-hexuluronate aminotransferase
MDRDQRAWRGHRARRDRGTPRRASARLTRAGARAALSTIATTSFFPTKPLGCYGDGGACFTNDDALAARMAQIRVHGQSKRYYHPIIGMNGRLDTLQAAVLLAKLDTLERGARRACAIGTAYSRSSKGA